MLSFKEFIKIKEEMERVEKRTLRPATIVMGSDGRPKWNFQRKRNRTVSEEEVVNSKNKIKKVTGSKEVRLKNGDKVVIDPKIDQIHVNFMD